MLNLPVFAARQNAHTEPRSMTMHSCLWTTQKIFVKKMQANSVGEHTAFPKLLALSNANSGYGNCERRLSVTLASFERRLSPFTG